jgi:hypothetical protein
MFRGDWGGEMRAHWRPILTRSLQRMTEFSETPLHPPALRGGDQRAAGLVAACAVRMIL